MTNFYLLISQRGAILADAATPDEAIDKRAKLRDLGTEASIYFCNLVGGKPVQDIAAAFTEVTAPVAAK